MFIIIITRIMFLLIFIFFNIFHLIICIECPKYWIPFNDSCYRFSFSPIKNFTQAKEYCNFFDSHLLVVSSYDEHLFITKYLTQNDPRHSEWLTSAFLDDKNIWRWFSGGSKLLHFIDLWLPYSEIPKNANAAYVFSSENLRWGLLPIKNNKSAAYICEITKQNIHFVKSREINIDYGILLSNPDEIERGPIINLEPKSVVFDLNERERSNFVSLRCAAIGNPTPEYKWFKEDNRYSQISTYIDPLSHSRFMQTDGNLMIFNPQKGLDDGKYHCQATNRFGTTISQSAEITFGFINSFRSLREEENATTYKGKIIVCDAPKYFPNVLFYWTKDNIFPNLIQQNDRIFVSNDGNLYISAVTQSDSGMYNCNVLSPRSKTGKFGPNFYLHVQKGNVKQKLTFPSSFPKSFPSVPIAGEQVKLECVAFSYPLPKYKWYRIGKSNKIPGHWIQESYNRTIIIPEIKVEDTGEYACQVESENNGFITGKLSINVLSRPVILVPLRDIVKEPNGNITLTCEAFGKPEVSYAWWKNGQILNISNLPIEDKIRYNIKHNVLQIKKVNKSKDEGMYQCQAINALGSNFSTGQLVVRALPPTFDKFPLNDMYGEIGQSLVIPCLPEALPAPEFQWIKNEKTVNSSRMQKLSNGFLKIDQITKEDEGWYICVASNIYGNGRTQGYLHIIERSHISEYPPVSYVGKINQTIQLPCDVHSDSSLEMVIIWLHNGIEILEGDKYRKGSLPGYLEIRNLTFAESGNYSCVGKTFSTTVFSHTSLFVQGPPSPCGALLADTINANSAIIRWFDGFYNGKKILSYKIEGRTNYNSSWSLLGKFKSDYVNTMHNRKWVQLPPVLSPWSKYKFRVIAINEIGEGEPSAPSLEYTTLEDKPYKFPTNLGGEGGNTGTLTITWDPLHPSDWNAPIIWYKIFYKHETDLGDYQTENLRRLGNIGKHTIGVGEKNIFKKYRVRIKAINSHGEGPLSPEAFAYSAEGVPQIKPNSVKAFSFNSTALNVTWNPVDISAQELRGKLIGYRIKYWKSKDNESSIKKLNRVIENYGLIVDLEPNTEYYATVSAFNRAGEGPESEPVLQRTLKKAPSRPPTDVTVHILSNTRILVIWKGIHTVSDEEVIIGYKVKYWKKGKGISSAKEMTTDSQTLEVIIPNLRPKLSYVLRVLAYSKGGNGKMSSPEIEFTIKDEMYHENENETNENLLLIDNFINEAKSWHFRNDDRYNCEDLTNIANNLVNNEKIANGYKERMEVIIKNRTDHMEKLRSILDLLIFLYHQEIMFTSFCHLHQIITPKKFSIELESNIVSREINGSSVMLDSNKINELFVKYEKLYNEDEKKLKKLRAKQNDLLATIKLLQLNIDLVYKYNIEKKMDAANDPIKEAFCFQKDEKIIEKKYLIKILSWLLPTIIVLTVIFLAFKLDI